MIIEPRTTTYRINWWGDKFSEPVPIMRAPRLVPSAIVVTTRDGRQLYTVLPWVAYQLAPNSDVLRLSELHAVVVRRQVCCYALAPWAAAMMIGGRFGEQVRECAKGLRHAAADAPLLALAWEATDARTPYARLRKLCEHMQAGGYLPESREGR